LIIRERDRVRLISRGGHYWARQFPLIVEAAPKLRQKYFLDGEDDHHPVAVVAELEGPWYTGGAAEALRFPRGDYRTFRTCFPTSS
jgi:hypothetical protein